MTTQPFEGPRPVELWELDFTFGDRIRKARRVLGLTVEQMATGLGVTKQVVSQWETGVSNPRSAHMIARTAEHRYGVPAWWLLGNETAPVEDEGRSARPEGFEPPTFCLAVGGEPLAIANRLPVSVTTPDSGAVVIDITDRLPHNPGTPELGGGAVADVITLPTWRNRPSVIREAVAR